MLPNPPDSAIQQVASLNARINKAGRLRIRSEDLPGPNKQKIGSSPLARFYEIQVAGSSHLFYRAFEGKLFWRPTIPSYAAPVGARVSLRLRLLTHGLFLENLKEVRFLNSIGIRRAPKRVRMSFEVIGKGAIRLHLDQERGRMKESFHIQATITNLGSSNRRPRLIAKVNDLFSREKRLALYHDGDCHGLLGVEDGRQFRIARLVFSDGIRLIIAYSKFRRFNLWTSYLKSPVELFDFELEKAAPSFLKGLPTSHLHFKVRILRALENKMLYSGTAYEHGRLGAEIAHSVGTRFLGLSNPVIGEPSAGGRDLWTADHRFSIQARLIADFTQFLPFSREEAIKTQLASLARKLGQDFANNSAIRVGFIIFSYLDDEKTLRSIVVRKVRGSGKQGKRRVVRARWDLNS